MTNIYHATPYDISATGFYFKTYEEYAEKADSHINAYGDPVEEYEIQFIDGDNHELFKALGVTQANLEQWFDGFENLDGHELECATYLAVYRGYDMDNLHDRIDDVHLFEGTAEDYAEEYLESTGMLNEVPESLRYYIDTKAFARDLLLGGDIEEVTINGTRYIAEAHF